MESPRRYVNLHQEQNNRRDTDRFDIEREVRFKVLNRKGGDETGVGKTINLSSNGLLITTDRRVVPGKNVEVSISWHAQLNSTIPLKLVARGRVVRSEDTSAAVEIQHSEFRTQASQGPKAAQ
jgi:Flp pilus assembly protein TadG